MKRKVALFLFMVILFILIKYRKRKEFPIYDADIIISPGGYKGLYTIGICHYIKTHFDVTKKRFAGFSSGSFNTLFMTLDSEQNNEFLRQMFSLDKRNQPISTLLTRIVNTLKKNFTDKDFDLNRINVGVSTTTGLKYFNHFLSLEDALYCCKCSSFIPFLTYNDMFLFYRGNLTLDGALYYKKVRRTKSKETLFIESSMFGRYTRNLTEGLKKPKATYYQLYLNGYHDARMNHDYLAQYFNP
jgi:hypothetical protein